MAAEALDILELLGVALDTGVADLESQGVNSSTKIGTQLDKLVLQLKTAGFLTAEEVTAVKKNTWIGWAGFGIGFLAVAALASPVGAVSEAIGAAATSAAAEAVTALFADTGYSIFGSFVASEILAATQLMTAIATATINYVVSEGASALTELAAKAGFSLGDFINKLSIAAPSVYNDTAVVASIGLPTNVAIWDTNGNSVHYTEFSSLLSATKVKVQISNSSNGGIVAVITNAGIKMSTLDYGGILGGALISIDGGKIDPQISSPPYIEETADDSIIIGLPDMITGTATLIDESASGLVEVEIGAKSSAIGEEVLTFVAADFRGDTLDITNPTSSSTKVTVDIGSGETFELTQDQSDSGVTQKFAFLENSGTLRIDDPADFTGTISGFVHGDIIDLMGIGTATSATLGANNVLTVGTSSGSIIIDFDSNQNFGDDSFSVSADGNGGTKITLVHDEKASFETLDIPTSGFGVFTDGGTYLTGINDKRQIVGYYEGGTLYESWAAGIPGVIPTTEEASFVYKNGEFTEINADISSIPSYPTWLYETSANGINNVGTIIGTDYNVVTDGIFTDLHGFLYNDQDTTIITDPNDVATVYNATEYNGIGYGYHTFLTGINNNGICVGYFGSDTPFLYHDGKFTSLSSIYKSEYGIPHGINDSNDILFASGILESNGKFLKISDPKATGDSSNDSIATAFNDSNEVVGYYSNSTGEHGFLYENGIYTTIDDPNGIGHTQITGINNVGQIVGDYTDSNGVSHGFVGNLSGILAAH